MFIAILALVSMAGFSQGIKFTEGTFDQLKAEAKKTDRPIFIDVYATWCGPCIFLASDIFTKDDVGKYMNEKFVNAKFDAEKGEGIDIAKKYKVKAYPTMLILDAEGKELGRVVGAERTTEAFIKKIEEATSK
ncbi:putative disulphide-isomerase [Mucinivorans hirudinis]|uniref:Putative disulphide-isomerase n=1 Tax=Mucinivorans hirudinis TaxID=1433126 RepID=A0A060RCB5_9BACT|nr:putative disulphide-isomerase [Mucinivorans hirudinis]